MLSGKWVLIGAFVATQSRPNCPAKFSGALAPAAGPSFRSLKATGIQAASASQPRDDADNRKTGMAAEAKRLLVGVHVETAIQGIQVLQDDPRAPFGGIGPR